MPASITMKKQAPAFARQMIGHTASTDRRLSPSGECALRNRFPAKRNRSL